LSDDEERRTFAGEVKNLHASRKELAVDLTTERDLHRARRGLSSHSVKNGVIHRLCRQNRSLLWSRFASIHDVDEN